MTTSGKGSTQSPLSVSQDEFASRRDETFSGSTPNTCVKDVRRLIKRLRDGEYRETSATRWHVFFMKLIDDNKELAGKILREEVML